MESALANGDDGTPAILSSRLLCSFLTCLDKRFRMVTSERLPLARGFHVGATKISFYQ
jgi:hypothetical protein